MFSSGGSVDKQDQIMGMFELPARHKLLEAKRATRRNRELSQLCDKCDDLVALTAELSRMLLRYVEKQLPDSVIIETQEFEKFKNMLDIDFETFRLIKHVMIEHVQRTEKASQLVDVLESVGDKKKKADIIRVGLEIALHQNDYSTPKGVNASILHPPLSMSSDELEKLNDRYEGILKKVDDIMCSERDDQAKYAYLAQLLTPPRRSRTAKTLILVRALFCSELLEASKPHHTMELEEFLAAIQEQEPPSPMTTFAPSLPITDVEDIHNGMMEERLRRLFSNDEENKGGNE